MGKDLKNRIIFTVLMLCVYRLGTYVPLAGIDMQSLQSMMETKQSGLLGMFNIFSGGAVSRMAIFALGIMPYISSSIIIQLLTGVSDYFKNLKSQGEIGRKKITQYTRYGTVLLATIQGYGVSVGLESSAGIVINPGTFFKITTVITINRRVKTKVPNNLKLTHASSVCWADKQRVSKIVLLQSSLLR